MTGRHGQGCQVFVSGAGLRGLWGTERVKKAESANNGHPEIWAAGGNKKEA